MAAPRDSVCILGLLLLAASAHGAVQKVTPVEKVTELLRRLEAQIEEEGKVEAAQYDKYACFCKEQADDKLYAIEKSEAKIKKLDAEIAALRSEIAELTSKIGDLTRKIANLEEVIAAAVALRAKEHAGYLEEAADMDGAITALVGAIKALKDSKAAMTDAKLDFVQLRAMATAVLQTIERSSSVRPSDAQLAAVQVLLGGNQSPPTYTYHSNDIIATLQGLLVQFKENKKELDEHEFASKAAFEKEKLNNENEKKFAEKEKAETETLLGMKEDLLATAQADLLSETHDKEADEAFLKELTGTCETKAKLFDQRSSTRAAELQAVSEAISTLESGVAPNWSANKKLVDLQTGSKAVAASRESGRVLSLLQQGSVSACEKAPLARALSLLDKAAQHLQSPLLATLSMKARVQIDHFVKVRGLIKDFVSKLEADAEAEADTKSFCDKEMAAAIEMRDDKRAELEKLAAEISKTDSEIAQLQSEIAVLGGQISELYKALKEAKELRAAEKAANEKTLAEAEEGKEAVAFAISLLKEFYENAFLQQSGRYVPPNADREGGTVSDLAPEIFDDKYHGKQDHAEGIIAILEVILSDFERTLETVAAEEKEAQAEFEAFEKDTEEDIAAKERSKADKKDKVVELTDHLGELQDSRKDAKKALDIALAELEKLKGMCVEGEETWEDRSAKRRGEIEALKDALKILDEWQS